MQKYRAICRTFKQGGIKMDILKEETPIARKEYSCDYCGGIIKIGEKYNRATIKNDYIYDWVSHLHCYDLTGMIDTMWLCDNDGLTSDDFKENINGYVYDNHYDDSIDDIAKEWQLPFSELCKKVYQELKEKEDQK